MGCSCRRCRRGAVLTCVSRCIDGGGGDEGDATYSAPRLWKVVHLEGCVVEGEAEVFKVGIIVLVDGIEVLFRRRCVW